MSLDYPSTNSLILHPMRAIIRPTVYSTSDLEILERIRFKSQTGQCPHGTIFDSFQHSVQTNVARDSSIGIATRYGLDGAGIESL
jgi:hypothetical protein